jgi:hypothetical protein
MMNWFFKWLRKKLDHSVYAKEDAPQIGLAINKSRRHIIKDSDDLSTEPIQFKMYKASGGWAIEFRQYDNKNDRMDANLYVVTNENDLGKSISQIITMEALKR